MNNVLKNRSGSTGLEFQSASRFFRPGVSDRRLKLDTNIILRLMPAFNTDIPENDPSFKTSWVPCGKPTADNVFEVDSQSGMIVSSGFFLALDACYGAYTGWGRNSFHEGGDNCPVLDLFKYCKAKGPEYAGYIERPGKKEKALVEKPSTQCITNARTYDDKQRTWVEEIVTTSFTAMKILLMDLASYRTASGHPVSQKYPNTAFGDPTDPEEGYYCRVYPGMTDPTNPSRQSALIHLSSNKSQGFTEAEYNSVRYPLDTTLLEERHILWDTENVLVEPPSYQEIVDMYVEKADTPDGLPLTLLQEAWSRKANVGPSTALGVPGNGFGQQSAPAMPGTPAASAPAAPMPAAPAMPGTGGSPAVPTPSAPAPAAPAPAAPAPAAPAPAAPAPAAPAPAAPAPAAPTPGGAPGNPLPQPGSAQPGAPAPGLSGFPEPPTTPSPAPSGMPSVPSGAGTPPPPAVAPQAPKAEAPKDTRKFWVAGADGKVADTPITAAEAEARMASEKIQLCDAADTGSGWKLPDAFGLGQKPTEEKKEDAPAQAEEKDLAEWISKFEMDGPQSVPAHLHPQIVAAINNRQ